MTEFEYPLQANEPPETDDGHRVIWENPDVPPLEDIIDTEETEFDCPYPDCTDFVRFTFQGGADENRESLEDLISAHDGTLRCEECNEPIYGFYADGDHE